MNERKIQIQLDESIADTSLKEVMEYFAVKYAALILDVTDLEKLTVRRIIELAQERRSPGEQKCNERGPLDDYRADVMMRFTRIKNGI